MSWTRAIVGGLLLWVVVILFVGQIPSWLIYKADADVSQLIEFSKHIPGVGDAGLNTTQIRILRDIVANGVQFTFLAAILAGVYFWQKAKQRRTGKPDAGDRMRELEAGQARPARKAG
jgi:hypothetical protein